MEESISSSRTTAFHAANSYHHYRHQPPAPPATATTATTASDADDSGWTAYFLQLASDEEEEASASMAVSKPNKAKDNKEAVNKVLKKGVKKTKEVLHLVGTTRIVEEEDPLQDTASSPLVQLININGRRPEGSLEHSCREPV